jgi:hypothetical protein
VSPDRPVSAERGVSPVPVLAVPAPDVSLVLVLVPVLALVVGVSPVVGAAPVTGVSPVCRRGRFKIGRAHV